MSQFPETDRLQHALNANIPPEKFAVVGSSAIEAVVGPDALRAAQTDLAVDPETYRQLRERHDLTEVLGADGQRSLRGDGYDISANWSGRTVEELQKRGYEVGGVHVAGLPDVYEQRQERGREEDQRDLQVIRNRLYKGTVLPDAVLAGEMRFVQSFIPERLHGRPELKVVANGLMIVRTVFGHADEGVRVYGGSVEPGEVPATYHEWKHSGLGTREGWRHGDIANQKAAEAGLPPVYTDDEQLAGAAGYANHDARLGDGRRSINPTGHDELQSAELVARQLKEVGASDQVAEGGYATSIATTFNEQKKAQDVDPSRGHVKEQQLGAGQDMSRLRTPGVEPAMALVPEDLSREAHIYGGALQQLVRQLNAERPAGTPRIAIRSVGDAYRLIEENPDFPVIKAGDPPKQMTLHEAAIDHLEGSAGFYGFYRHPGGWQRGSEVIQQQNAAKIRGLAEKIKAGELTWTEAYAASFDNTPEGREVTYVDMSSRRTQTGTNAGGEVSIAALRASVAAESAGLPLAELAGLQEQVANAAARLAVVLEGAEQSPVQPVHQHLTRASAALTAARDAMQTAKDLLQNYHGHLG